MTTFKTLKNLSAIIMGAPGGGKGTICNKLKKDFTFNHVSESTFCILLPLFM